MIKRPERYCIAIALILISQLALAQFKSDSTKRVRFAAIPMINYNRTQGIIVGAMTSAFYKINRKDTLSPESNSAAFGMYTGEKSWAVAVGQILYLNEDKWRIKAFLVKGNVNYQYFNGDANTNVGQYEDYANDVAMAIGQAQRKIWGRIYGGLYLEYNTTETHFITEGDSIDTRSMNNIGYVFSLDSRDNVQFPTRGVFMNFKNQFYTDWMGSDNNFVRFHVNYNQFFDLLKDQRHILVARANLSIASDDVPFQGQDIVGGDDIRGYSQGQFRGNQVYSIQTEYRWMFNNSRFGMVGFFGVASAVETFSDIFKTQLLPGGGAGIRFQMIPAMKVNIGADVGFGKDDYSITFRIGEAFGR